MRSLWSLAAALSLAACGTMEYRDTNAAVDSNPLCVSRPDQPGEPVSRDCERYREGVWRSKSDTQPVEFGRRDER